MWLPTVFAGVSTRHCAYAIALCDGRGMGSRLQQNWFQASVLSPISVRMGKFPNFFTLQFPYLQNKNIKHTS